MVALNLLSLRNFMIIERGFSDCPGMRRQPELYQEQNPPPRGIHLYRFFKTHPPARCTASERNFLLDFFLLDLSKPASSPYARYTTIHWEGRNG